MHVLTVSPITRLPRGAPSRYTYFSTTPLPPAALVKVTLRRRSTSALVLESAPLDASLKQQIKSAGFELKPIETVINPNALLNSPDLALFKATAGYFGASLPALLKHALPEPIIAGAHKPAREARPAPKDPVAKLIWGQGRQLKIFEIIKAWYHKARGPLLILAPTLERLHYWQAQLAAYPTVAWQSRLSQRKRAEIWRFAQTGEPKIFIGTRGAVFLPLANLQQIITDHEHHEGHLNSQQSPYYDARWVAKEKARLWGATLTLTSPLPSLEAYTQTPTVGHPKAPAKFTFFEAPPFARTPKPELTFAEALAAKVSGLVAESQKILWYHNRRGLAPVLICSYCKAVPRCSVCRSALAWHRQDLADQYQCHTCGQFHQYTTRCAKCQRGEFRAIGFGTAALAAGLKQTWPQVPQWRLDRDSAVTPKIRQKILAEFLNTPGAVFLIGTAAALAPSYQVAAVVVPQLDLDLFFPNYTSHEDTWLTLGELSEHAPLIMAQTLRPKLGLIQLLGRGDFALMYQRELKIRAALNLPPVIEHIVCLANRATPWAALDLGLKLVSTLTGWRTFWQNQNPNLNLGIIGPVLASRRVKNGRAQAVVVLALNKVPPARRAAILANIPTPWTILVNPRNMLI